LKSNAFQIGTFGTQVTERPYRTPNRSAVPFLHRSDPAHRDHFGGFQLVIEAVDMDDQ
jgi:hypothetical protein